MLSLLFVSVTFLRIFHPVKSPRVILLGVPSQQVNACFTIKTFAACMQCYLHFSGYRAVQYLSLAHSHSLSVSLYAVFVVGICYVFMDFSFSKIPYNRVILWDTQLFPVPPTPTRAWGHHVYIQFNDSVLILNLTVLQSLNFFSHFFINKISRSSASSPSRCWISSPSITPAVCLLMRLVICKQMDFKFGACVCNRDRLHEWLMTLKTMMFLLCGKDFVQCRNSVLFPILSLARLEPRSVCDMNI